MPDIATLRNLIDTVVILMFENRSFDHVLGHLSLSGASPLVEGLRTPLRHKRYENLSEGQRYYPFPMFDQLLPDDLPHERPEVDTQMRPGGTIYSMGGFVKAYHESQTTNRTGTPEAMGYLTSEGAPATTFLAHHFAICDHWFCPLPTSTRPNKLMALTGDSRVDTTDDGISFPKYDNNTLITEWLAARGVRCRVYHDGLSFFLLLKKFREVLFDDDKFRNADRLRADFMDQSGAPFPQVIIVEPTYSLGDILSTNPNDNHAPLPMAPGEDFLLRVCGAITSNPARWLKTALIITYDEHGGFFDHVRPLRVSYHPPGGEYPDFTTTGPRVPGIVVSPLVSAGRVCTSNMDHTSVLQFIAELFGKNNETYSPSVDARRAQGIASLSEVFDLNAPRTDAISIPSEFEIPVPVGLVEQKRLTPPLRGAFGEAARMLKAQYPVETQRRFPALQNWQ